MRKEQALQRIADVVNTMAGDPAPKAELIAPAGMEDGERTELVIDGFNTKWLVEIFPERTGDMFRKRETGRMRMNIGDYGNKTQFIEGRDGTFDYPKAARVLVGIARQKKDAKAIDKAREENEELARQIRARTKSDDTGCISVKGVVRGISIKLTLEHKEVTPEVAEQVVAEWKRMLEKELI